MSRRSEWRLIRSRWVYHDARIVDMAWTAPTELTVTLESVSTEVPRFPTRPIVCFRGVRNRAEIDKARAAFVPNDVSCIDGFSRSVERGRFLLGPLVIECNSYVEP